MSGNNKETHQQRLRNLGLNQSDDDNGAKEIGGAKENGSTVGGDEKKSLYDRLGGIFAIAAVIDRFSDEVLKSPLVGINSPNPQLREWSREQSPERLPGLKFQRTLWVADISGGPLRYVGTNPGPGKSHLDLENAHFNLHITPAEFDEVARILAETLQAFDVPAPEKAEVLAAFASFKPRVTAGSAE
jgi:hemoglobin